MKTFYKYAGYSDKEWKLILYNEIWPQHYIFTLELPFNRILVFFKKSINYKTEKLLIINLNKNGNIIKQQTGNHKGRNQLHCQRFK